LIYFTHSDGSNGNKDERYSRKRPAEHELDSPPHKAMQLDSSNFKSSRRDMHTEKDSNTGSGEVNVSNENTTRGLQTTSMPSPDMHPGWSSSPSHASQSLGTSSFQDRRGRRSMHTSHTSGHQSQMQDTSFGSRTTSNNAAVSGNMPTDSGASAMNEARHHNEPERLTDQEARDRRARRFGLTSSGSHGSNMDTGSSHTNAGKRGDNSGGDNAHSETPTSGYDAYRNDSDVPANNGSIEGGSRGGGESRSHRNTENQYSTGHNSQRRMGSRRYVRGNTSGGRR
jgi:hypothetical protein